MIVQPMPSTHPSNLFTRFVRFVEKEYPSRNGPLTVKDLRLAIRQDRLTEVSVWSFKDLDDVEEECAQYGEAIVLTKIVASQPEQPALQATDPGET